MQYLFDETGRRYLDVSHYSPCYLGISTVLAHPYSSKIFGCANVVLSFKVKVLGCDTASYWPASSCSKEAPSSGEIPLSWTHSYYLWSASSSPCTLTEVLITKNLFWWLIIYKISKDSDQMQDFEVPAAPFAPIIISLFMLSYWRWRYDVLQCFAGIVTVSVGHCHERVMEAVNKQNSLLQHTTTIYLNNEVAQFAKELTDMMPDKLKASEIAWAKSKFWQ